MPFLFQRIALALLAASGPAAAIAGLPGTAGTDPGQTATVVTSGAGEVLVAPTNASFTVGIQTSGATSVAASAENAKLSKSVSDGLQAAGLSREELKSSRLSVGPHWSYDESVRRRKKAGFDASNTIRIETDHLDRIGVWIDSALTTGATDISDISFSAKNVDDARRKAISEAVASARADAEAMAKAGGGSLGELLLLSTEPTNLRPGVELQEISVTASRRRNDAIDTNVTPNEIKVTATIVARWRFVPGPVTH